jgi:hypothetical protein
MLKELDEIQDILHSTLEKTKDNWKELKQYTNQLKTVEKQTNDIEMGGIKISSLNDSLVTLTGFLEGAFQEVNKSVHDISKEINETKEKS